MKQNTMESVSVKGISEHPFPNSTKLFLHPNSELQKDLLESEKMWWWNLFSTEYTTIYYSVFFLSTITLSIVSSVTFFRWCVTASTRMHHKMFDNIVKSPMRFFNTNSSGRILNRFSKDIGVLDEFLPKIVMDTIQVSNIILGSKGE